MATDADSPLGPPPRKAHLRRGVRNLRRAYRSLFGMIVLVLGGWAAMDAFRWYDLSDHARWLVVGFGLAVLLALYVWRQVERPLGRELRLGRVGIAVKGTIVSIGKPHGRRAISTITYSFQTIAGVPTHAESALPRRFPVHRLAPGMELEVLYDPAHPYLNKPRLALSFIEFGVK